MSGNAVNYRLAVAKVLGEMLLEVMNPLYAEHPDLKCAGLELRYIVRWYPHLR